MDDREAGGVLAPVGSISTVMLMKSLEVAQSMNSNTAFFFASSLFGLMAMAQFHSQAVLLFSFWWGGITYPTFPAMEDSGDSRGGAMEVAS